MAPPVKLNPETQATIFAMLRQGNHLDFAAEAAGVSKRTAARWLERGAKGGKANADYAAFAAGVEKARAESHARHVGLIAAAASRSWQAAAWLLERGYPETWGKPGERVKAQADADEAKAVDPFAEVDDLRARRIAKSA